MGSTNSVGRARSRRALAALATVGLVVGLASSPGRAGSISIESVGQVATSPPASSPTPRAAVQTGAQKVKVTGSSARGTSRVRLLEDGTVVAESTGSTSLSFERTGVAVGSHTYSFQAGNAGGWADPSGTVSVTVVAAPDAPSTPSLEQTGDTSLEVTITRVAGATSYVVYAGGTALTTFKVRAGTGPVVKRLSKLTVGSTYSITVAAANVAGTSAASGAASMTMHAQMKRVTAPTAKDGTAQTGAGAVRVVAKVTPGAASHALVVDGSVVGTTPTLADGKVTFAVTGLTAAAHTFAIRATNPGYVTTSAALSLTVLPAPSAATGLAIQQTSDTVAKLTFTPGTGTTAATVAVDGTQVAAPRIPVGATTVTVTLPAMTALSSHSVTVTGSNVVGTAAASAPLAFTLHPALTATTGQPTAVQTGDGAVRVTIVPTTNATTYSLLQDGTKVADAVEASGSVRFDLTGVAAGRRYTFEVVAKNPRNSASKSRFVSLAVVPVLDDVPDVTATHSYGVGDTVSVVLSLAPSAGANGYRVKVDGVVSTTRYEPLALTSGRATITLSLDSTVDHAVEVVAFNTMGNSPASTAYDVPADPG